MGKEWKWGGKSSKRSGVDNRDTTSSAGCMCAVFQLFDFHQFQFTSLHQPQPAAASSNLKPAASTTISTTSTTTFQPLEEADIPKGVEAPRNSLKSEEGSSLSSIIEDEDQESLNLNTPMGIQIKTSSRSGLSPTDIFSDTSSNSPGTKTPSLVARLMGLDLLPETNSPTNNLTSPSTTTIHAAQRQHHLSRSHTQPLRARQPGGGLQNKARYLLDSDMSSGTRSLPETPRISSSRRSDVDLHHRLSLQINKENVDQADLDFSKLSALRRKQFRVEEHDQSASRSPSHYARQIVKQVKESVTRKVGLDITNTVRNRSENYHEQHFHNQPPKSRRVSKGLSKLEEQGISRPLGKQQNSSSTSSTSASCSCSPRLVRFSESKISTSSTTTSTTTTPIISTIPEDQYQAFEVSTVNGQGQTVKVNSGAKANYPKGHVQPLQEQQKMSKKSSGGGREGGGGAFGRRLQKMQEETFVRRPSAAANCRANIPDKKCKKTPLSNNLLNLNVVPTLLPVKKSPNSPPSTNKHVKQPAAEVPDDAQESKRSSQLSSSQSQKYHPQEPSSHVLHTRHIRSLNDIVHVPNDTTTTTTTRGGGSAQQLLLLRHYMTRILARTGIANTSHVSYTNWGSPSHPLDPSIFHRLEISTYVNNVNSNNNINLSEGQFHLRCNRKLMFDIVDEILVDILRPYINLKPWINYTNNNVRSKFNVNICNGMQGSELVDKLCSRIQSFPCTDCQVLEDIDALIDKDLPRQLKIQREMAFEEEGEGVVVEIERDIVDTLVHETALVLVGTWE